MPADESRLGIYFLDVGQGDCTFVVPPAGEGSAVLFDCRDNYVAERFVANHGIRHLRAAVASHMDMDHMRGLLPFLRTYFAGGGTLDLLVLGIDRKLHTGKNKAIAALLQQAIDWERTPPCAGFALREPVRDRTTPLQIASGTDWSVDIVLPFVGTRFAAAGIDGDAPNACSAVLTVRRNGRVVHVGGDAVLGSWERLEDTNRRADVIRVPHHGGEIRGDGETWSQFSDLYDHVGASTAFVSVGTNNSFGHPLPAHIAAARRGGECVVRCTELTRRCHTDPMALRSEALSIAGAVEPPYRHVAERGHGATRPAGEVPCAGSMVVWLGADGALGVEPSPGGPHDDLLAKVPNALCS